LRRFSYFDRLLAGVLAIPYAGELGRAKTCL
jgi:hypothetical protein